MAARVKIRSKRYLQNMTLGQKGGEAVIKEPVYSPIKDPRRESRNPMPRSEKAIAFKDLLWGLITRKERWGLSWRGWSVVLLGVIAAGGFIGFRLQPFLATTARVNTKVLVVEGWVHDYTISAALDEFKTGSYEKV